MTSPQEPSSMPPLDYEKSLSELSKRLAEMNSSTWSPTPQRKAAVAMAEKLIALADELDGVQWCWLEDVCDAPEPGQIDPRSGLTQPGADRSGFFKITLSRMREMAAIAHREADSLAKPSERRALRFAATTFLHILYQCEKPFPPSLYDYGQAVSDLDKVCQEAGVIKARETLRNSLSAALKDFDPFFYPYGETNFLFYSES